MDNRTDVINRLRELASEHQAALGEGPGRAPGFIQDEQITRKSYRTVVDSALNDGVLSEDDLHAEGLPKYLD